MSELMISPTPTPPPGGPANANALNQSNATSRSGDSPKTDGENQAESPFAAVLKSQVDKKAAATADKANAQAAARTDAENAPTGIDLSALFPFLGANPAGTDGVAVLPQAATEQAAAAPVEKLLPELQAAAAPLPAPILLAAPPSAPAALPAAPSVPLKPAPVKPDVEAQGETFTAAGPAKQDEPGRAAGKIEPGPAISADAAPRSGEKNSPELLAGDFRSLLERATAMTPAAASPVSGPSSSPSLRIDTPLGQAGWHDEMGQKLTWMVGNNRQQADLVLTPPHLGRVEVSLTMNGDQATAIFTSPNPAVREALEGSLHRLREVLADAGVSLGQTHVGSESPNQSSRKNEPDFGLHEGVRYASTIPLPGVAATARTGSGRSMVDIFA